MEMTDAARPTLRLEAVRKEFSAGFRLEIGELAFRSGETVCLLGPAGAGKTTLLRLLAGVETPTSGQVHWEPAGGSPATVPLAIRRSLAMVAQRPLLLTGTVRENVEYGWRLRGAATERKTLVTEWLQRLQLEPLANQSARTLSGGQTQLVAVARALVLQPELLLLDEPTAHLDPARVQLIEEAVRAARAARPMTIIWATHNLFQAQRMADRVALLWNGQLVELADRATFFQHPSDPRTADFLAGRLIY